ncbi:MAG TPA: hypothetical protein VMT70_08135 [Vicinamibacteria bacterium]|nr:hypothetical protein [Vicinamibacteria bacterium]
MASPLRRIAILALVVPWAGCFEPDPVPAPTPKNARLVSVPVLYRQPNGCVNTSSSCDNLVVFFGSWMRPGQEIYLASDPGSHVWTGVALGVPVNWPPADEPYLVRVFDPHLVDTPTGGVTAARLMVGGQLLDQFDQPGTPKESGLVYIDDNGVGHVPF